MESDAVFLGFGTPMSARQALRNPDQVQHAEKVIAHHMQALGGNESRYRRNFLQRLSEIPADALNPTANQVVDAIYYNTKSISGKSNVKLFTSSEKMLEGYCNVADGKLEPNKPFCLSDIQVLYAVHGTSGGTDPSALDFAAISAALRNGHMTLKANGRVVLEKVSMEVFRTPTNEVVGLYKLANSKMIQPGVAMELFIEWGTAAATDAWIKVVLRGAGMDKA